jgi:ribosomal-protein-alanine N-acetyltransferase
MKTAGVEFRQLSRIAVTRGPGTFTGLRIGLSMARGLGISLGIPVIGISSLAAIAASAAGVRTVAVAARGGEFYHAAYDEEDREIVKPCVVRYAEVIKPPEANELSGLPRASRFAPLAAKLAPETHPPEPLYLRQPDIKPQYTVQRVDAQQLLAATLLAELHGESFETAWSRDEFSTMLAVPRTAALVISHGGEPAGFGLFRQAADEAEIIALATRPPLRRRGLGRSLMQEIERELKSSGAHYLFLEVAASNLPARALYARAGFHEAGRRKDYYARNGFREDALVLRKAL